MADLPIEKLRGLRDLLEDTRTHLVDLLGGPAEAETDRLGDLREDAAQAFEGAEGELAEFEESLKSGETAALQAFEDLDAATEEIRTEVLPELREDIAGAETAFEGLDGHVEWLASSTSDLTDQGFTPLGTALDTAQQAVADSGERLEAAFGAFEARLRELASAFENGTQALAAAMDEVHDEASDERGRIQDAAQVAARALSSDAQRAASRCGPVRDVTAGAYENFVGTLEAEGEAGVDAVREVLDQAAQEVRATVPDEVLALLNDLVANAFTPYLNELDAFDGALGTASVSEEALRELAGDLFTAKRSVDVIDQLLEAMRTS